MLRTKKCVPSRSLAMIQPNPYRTSLHAIERENSIHEESMNEESNSDLLKKYALGAAMSCYVVAMSDTGHEGDLWNVPEIPE